MSRNSKNTAMCLFRITGILAPLAVFAQSNESAGPATFTGSITLWIAIIIGAIASVSVIRYGVVMKGSNVGIILSYVGIGMLLIVLGFLSVVIAWAPTQTQKITHDLLFITGYVVMLMGALRLKKFNV